MSVIFRKSRMVHMNIHLIFLLQKYYWKLYQKIQELEKYQKELGEFVKVSDLEPEKVKEELQFGVLSKLKTHLEPKTRTHKHIVVRKDILSTRVPILKLENTQLGVEMDLSEGSILGTTNTKFLYVYSQIHPKVQKLVCLVKNWAKARHINDASTGSLSSYSYAILTLSFLQEMGFVPSLQQLISHPNCVPEDVPAPHYVDGFDCRYFSNLTKLNKIWKPRSDINSYSLAQLFLGFMSYYSQFFNKKEC